MARFIIKIFLTCVFLLILFTAYGQNVYTVSLKGFVHDAMDTKLTNSELAEKYLCTDILTSKEKYGKEARAYLKFAFAHQRKYLRDKQVNANKVSLKPFSKFYRKANYQLNLFICYTRHLMFMQPCTKARFAYSSS